jgi:ureidoglycolate hydrolase
VTPPLIQVVSVEPLEREAFSPFGAVIAPETYSSPRFNRAPGNLGVLWVQKQLEFPGPCFMCTVRYYYRGLRCEFLQRHPASTVTLIPLGLRPSVVVAAGRREDDSPDLGSIHAFLLDGDAGVVFDRGTWLRYAYAIGDHADFAYVTQRVNPATANSSDDTERFRLDEQAGVVLELQFHPPADAELDATGSVISRPQPR